MNERRPDAPPTLQGSTDRPSLNAAPPQVGSRAPEERVLIRVYLAPDDSARRQTHLEVLARQRVPLTELQREVEARSGCVGPVAVLYPPPEGTDEWTPMWASPYAVGMAGDPDAFHDPTFASLDATLAKALPALRGCDAATEMVVCFDEPQGPSVYVIPHLHPAPGSSPGEEARRGR